jgi:3-isopropylmalate/(R)-2-methylmalate dehydratase small subunit
MSELILLKGKVHKYGDNVDTDVIIPARYLTTTSPQELAKHCLEDLDAEFVNKVRPGDIIVAGENFGCGSSREHAPISIKAAGVSCVVAKSFARIFFRNAINIGLPVLECAEAVEASQDGDDLEIDLADGLVRNLTNPAEAKIQPLPEFLRSLVAKGGLINYVRAKLGLAQQV